LKQRAAEQQKTESFLASVQNQIALLDAESSDAIANLSKSEKFTGPTASVDRLKEEIALLEKREGLTAIREQASQSVGNDEGLAEAENLLIELEIRKKKNQLIAEEMKLRESAKDKEANELQKLAADQEKQRDQQLKVNEAFEKEKANNAKKLADEQLSKEESLKKSLVDKAINPDKLQATEGRLLTRGQGSDPQAAIVENTKKTNEELKQATNELKEIRRLSAQNSKGPTINFEAVA
jgi:hypothetical protein